MRWEIHGERALYESEWVTVTMADVEVPGGRRFDHHVVRVPDAAGAVVHDPDRGVLLLWRHRFIPDTWAWELPGGMVDGDEDPAQAARRETLEETGWEPGPLTELAHFYPVSGLSTQCFHLYLAEGASPVGAPADQLESERVEWVGMDEFRRIVREGEMLDGLSFAAALYTLAFVCNADT
ncbi:MAG: Methanol dehydrogenase activator [Acidimicrobiales bacterium]|nr:MAG: NUDIX hydrolase [Actinomycetota bacterium]MBV6509119.1 Methanol dehydrogenase activator [Acidimicrobiales bacterium]RIK08527.1 MAG: NUDIX hydrolase [Acidobacteriota bacterium]